MAKVLLLSYTPNPDKLCAASAYMTFTGKQVDALINDLTSEKIEQILKSVNEAGHHSVLEHANFTFFISGISRACSHQLVRHRIASFSQLSQRYVKVDNPESFVCPKTIAKNESAKRIFDETIIDVNKSYNKLIELGMPTEDARFVLPNAAKTDIVVTMNARELIHFFGLRCCTRAQWEIREMADQMLALAKQAAPIIFKNAGSRCIELGYCPEGKHSCGKYPTLAKLKGDANGSK